MSISLNLEVRLYTNEQAELENVIGVELMNFNYEIIDQGPPYLFLQLLLSDSKGK